MRTVSLYGLFRRNHGSDDSVTREMTSAMINFEKKLHNCIEYVRGVVKDEMNYFIDDPLDKMDGAEVHVCTWAHINAVEPRCLSNSPFHNQRR